MSVAQWKKKVSNLLKKDRIVTRVNKFKAKIRSLKPVHAQHLVGVDISSESIRILKINTNTEPYIVENFITTPLPAGFIVKDEIKEATALSGLINDSFKLAGITSKSVALAIPKSLAIIKNILVSNQLSTDEIESRAWMEASRHFPDLIGEIHLDFISLGPAVQDNTQNELMLVAVRKDHILPYLDVMKQAGLIPKIVDVNCYAYERALPLAAPETAHTGTVGMLSLNVTGSTFIVIQNGSLIHAHDQTYDGQRLLTQVAAFIKDNPDSVSMDEVRYSDILRENLISHLRHAIHFFYSSKPNASLKEIVLAGDCAIRVPHLSAFIQREMGIDTRVADPFKNLQLTQAVNQEELTNYAPALMLCCGLALSKVD